MAAELDERFGPYVIVSRLGRGATGVVYHAREVETGRDVALKVMHAEVAADDDDRARFLHEAEAIAQLRHRNIVALHDYGVWEGAPYIAMELLRGSTLAARLASREPLSLGRKLEIVIRLCEALQVAHEAGLVHRDVKPANVWLLENGGVKLLDFGIAKLAGSSLTRAGSVVGSAAYMSPEQAAGHAVDGRADTFAAGAILYELLAGRRAFDAEHVTGVLRKILHEDPIPLHAIVPDISGGIESAVETALRKDPNQRYEQIADFGAELRLALYQAQNGAVETGVKPAPKPEPSPTPVPASVVRAWTKWLEGTSPAVQRRAPWVLGTVSATVLLALGWLTLRPTPSPRFMVDVRSTPSGAAIVLDGRPTGQRTPALLTLDVRPQRVSLIMDGYEMVESPLSRAGAGSVERLSVTLRRLFTIESDPPGARIAFDGQDTGLVTPASVALADPMSAVLELRLGERNERIERLTPAMVESGTVHVKFPVAPRPSKPAITATTAVERPQDVRRRSVMVHVLGGYPFEVGGCEVNSPLARQHDFEVQAPCTIRLRAPTYFLDTTRSVDLSSDRVDISAPQLARVELRTRYEWCTVILNGRGVGSPPVELELASGTYTATIQCPDRTYSTGSFSIQPGTYTRRLDDFLH